MPEETNDALPPTPPMAGNVARPVGSSHPPVHPVAGFAHVRSGTERMGDNAGIRLVLPVGRSAWAVAAGYAGLFAIIIFPAPIAIILGVVAIIDIQGHPERHGMGRAVFALIAGTIGTVILLVMFGSVLFAAVTG